MKILHHVLAADTPHYREIKSAAKETWNSNNPDNIKTIYMYGDNDSIFYDGKDSFYVDKKEGLDICLYKTICAFEYFLKFDFDYIFRSNITGYFDYQVMNDFIKDKPLDNFYCGIVGSHGSILFASGSGFFISRNLVENIVENKNILYSYTYKLPEYADDVAIGKYITQDLGISIDISSRRINLTLDQIDDNLDMNQYHYRILNKGDSHAIHKIHKLKKCKNQ